MERFTTDFLQFSNTTIKNLSFGWPGRGHSKMMSPQKFQIFEPPPPYVAVSHIFHYNLPPSPFVTRQLVTNFFLDQRS